MIEFFWSKIDLLDAVVAFVAALLIPINQRVSRKRELLSEMVDVFEGYFYASSRHSVYNILRMAEIATFPYDEFKRYNIIKQEYECKFLSEYRERTLSAFSPEVVKKILQYEMLSRNFNSDLNSLIGYLEEKGEYDIHVRSMQKNIIDKNVRLFQISNNIKDIMTNVREVYIKKDYEKIVLDRIRRSADEGGAAIRILQRIESLFVFEWFSRPLKNIALAFLTMMYGMYDSAKQLVRSFYTETEAYTYMQNRSEKIDEINSCKPEAADALKVDIKSYITDIETNFHIRYNKYIDNVVLLLWGNINVSDIR